MLNSLRAVSSKSMLKAEHTQVRIEQNLFLISPQQTLSQKVTLVTL